MPANPTFSHTFGNPLIRGIEEIQLPEPVAWWPQAPGWWLLGLVMMAYLLYRSWRWGRRWWRDRYRRAALARLAALERQACGQWQAVVAELPFLLKVTALQAYPRTQVAALSGEEWLAFLDARYRGPSFRQGVGCFLLAIDYQPREMWTLNAEEARALIAQSRKWLRTHEDGGRDA